MLHRYFDAGVSVGTLRLGSFLLQVVLYGMSVAGHGRKQVQAPNGYPHVSDHGSQYVFRVALFTAMCLHRLAFQCFVALGFRSCCLLLHMAFGSVASRCFCCFPMLCFALLSFDPVFVSSALASLPFAAICFPSAMRIDYADIWLAFFFSFFFLEMSNSGG